MSVKKFTVSLEESLWKDVSEAAGEDAGGNLSAFIADALAVKLRLRLMDRAVREYEGEHGEITAEELAAAEAKLRKAGAL